jgi:hypothetical protein
MICRVAPHAKTGYIVGMSEPATPADEIDFDLADAITAVMADGAADRLWLPRELEDKTGGDASSVCAVLRYLVAHQYVESNGRGGCWERFRDLAYRPFG